MELRRLAPLLLLLLAAVAPPEDERRQNALMDRIERQLVLPNGAAPLGDYGRNYAPDGPDKVRALYTVPPQPMPADTGCSIMLANLKTRPCTRREIAERVRDEGAMIAAQAPAGKRRWFARASSLPHIADGGCSVVTIEYNIAQDRILRVSCNGLA